MVLSIKSFEYIKTDFVWGCTYYFGKYFPPVMWWKNKKRECTSYMIGEKGEGVFYPNEIGL